MKHCYPAQWTICCLTLRLQAKSVKLAYFNYIDEHVNDVHVFNYYIHVTLDYQQCFLSTWCVVKLLIWCTCAWAWWSCTLHNYMQSHMCTRIYIPVVTVDLVHTLCSMQYTLQLQFYQKSGIYRMHSSGLLLWISLSGGFTNVWLTATLFLPPRSQ